MVYAPKPVTRYCQQVSVPEFENQSKSISQTALEELLERILADKKMSSKDKKKRLKQFERTYPDIFASRFPSHHREATAVPPTAPVSKVKLPKVKQPLLTRPLSKLKGLRL